MIAYSVSGGMIDEYILTGEPTPLSHLKQFASVVVEFFKEEFLELSNKYGKDKDTTTKRGLVKVSWDT